MTVDFNNERHWKIKSLQGYMIRYLEEKFIYQIMLCNYDTNLLQNPHNIY